MIINSIYLKENNCERTIDFSNTNNLIHSSSNSKGKTTLLRLVLYSLGFNIPNIKHIKFEQCVINSKITLDDGCELRLNRRGKELLELTKNNLSKTYILPSQEKELHEVIFNTKNNDILNNILGAFYFDQEKGWTLLNRGVVIGKIRFNIEELIRGLSDVDCTELEQKKEQKKQDLLKYQQMYSVSKYQETIDLETNALGADSYNTIIDVKINQLKIKRNELQKEMHRVEQVLKDNSRFKNFISNIGLLVQISEEKKIRVTEKNIVGLNDSIDFLEAKRKMIAIEYNKVFSEIKQLETERKEEERQLSFFDNEETIADIFDRKISSIPINVIAVKNHISTLEKEIKEINAEIKRKTTTTKSAISIISSLYQNTKKYLDELGLDGQNITEKYLFTSNLKELSGAILHKTVFAYKLACVLEIENQLKIHLPIILDSPKGKEVDELNIKTMINILKRDFKQNQIIIASIFDDYDLPQTNIIEIVDHLIE